MLVVFFFKDTATTEIYTYLHTLALHDALPISSRNQGAAMIFAPLDRFVVLDLSRVRSGPTAVRQFADWGADVIKIEEPSEVKDDKPGGAAKFSDYKNTHRNKRSMTLHHKHHEAKTEFLELLKRATVLTDK